MTPDLPPLHDKAFLRQWARQVRAALDWPALSAALCDALRALPEMADARDVLLYLPLRDEADVEPLAGDAARRWYVPRCAENRRLAVHRYVPGETPLRRGPFGLREPDPALVPETDPAALDLVILPALLLAETGDRLGYGGGYYDRLLPRLAPGCALVGALPHVLVLPELPRDPWDRPVSVVVTENRVIRPAAERRRIDR